VTDKRKTPCLDTIVNQRGGDVNCIYVAVGQKRSTVAQVVESSRVPAPWSTRRRRATASEAAPLQFIAPYTGCGHGRVLPRQRPARVDHLPTISKQRRCIRQLSLLLRRPPDASISPATSSICTRACSSVPPRECGPRGGSLTLCPSSKPRPATCRRTFPPTSSRSPTARSTSKATLLFRRTSA